MNILHLIGQRPDSTGSGFYLQALLREAADAGYHNSLVASIQKEPLPNLEGVPPENLFPIAFETPENPGRIVGMSDVMPYPSRRFRDLAESEVSDYLGRFEKHLRAVAARTTPDLIHCHHLWLLSALAGDLFSGLPVVCSCHGSDLRQFRQCTHLQQRVLSGCRRLDAVFALSADQAREIAGLYGIAPGRIVVAGAGYNDQLFRPPLRKPSGAVQILYAGKLSRAKGVPWLLEALARFPGSRRFHLHLAGHGWGPELEHCHRLAARLGDRVTIHGTLEQRELARLMQQAHVFILPSLHEGLPLAVLEALASGCLVAATDLPGTREIQKHVNGTRLRLIPTPQISDTNTSLLEDEPLFISNIVDALESLLGTVDQPPAPVADLAFFTWRGVFTRIEAVWLEVLDTRDSGVP